MTEKLSPYRKSEFSHIVLQLVAAGSAIGIGAVVAFFMARWQLGLLLVVVGSISSVLSARKLFALVHDVAAYYSLKL